MTAFAVVAATSEDVRAESGRSAKVARLAACLAELDPTEVPAAVAFLSGRLLQRQTGAGWAALRDLPEAAAEPALDGARGGCRVRAHGGALGPGIGRRPPGLLHELFGRATSPEQRLLRGLRRGRAAPGRPGGGHDRGGGAGGGRSHGGVAAGAHAARRPGRGGRNRAPRGRRRAARLPARGGAAGAAHAGPDRRERRGRVRAARGGCDRVEARRRPHPGAPKRRGRGGVHAHPGRDYVARARGRRGGPAPARDRVHPRRRGDRARAGRTAARVSDHGSPHRRRAATSPTCGRRCR